MTKNVIKYYVFYNKDNDNFELHKWNNKKYYMQHIRNYKNNDTIKMINDDIKRDEKDTTKKIKIEYCF